MRKQERMNLYETMVLIRAFEEEVEYHSKMKNFHGTTHLYIGQEAVATGVCANLTKGDYMTSTHRGHGHAIAMGANLKKMMAEMFGKETGYCKGLGGSMHIADPSIGHLGSNGVVAANIPLAVGAALTIQMQKRQDISLCFFGDGATNEGAFHEVLNMAAIWKLPVVFVCENNVYGMSSPIESMSAASSLTDLASKWQIPSYTVDGNDVEAVKEVSEKAISFTRLGNGPTFIEAKTYRYRGHSRSDKQGYRQREEVEKWLAKDPIQQLEERLIQEENIRKETLIQVADKARKAVKAATEYAITSDELPSHVLEGYIYASKVGEHS